MFISVVIPTYNRWPILEKCLVAMEQQTPSGEIEGYEVVLVDDGSTDGTPDLLRQQADRFPHVRLFEQAHGGPAEGRNRGVDQARGDVIVFIDSDLVVVPGFLASHARALQRTWTQRGDRLCFTYGAVINTANFEEPRSERHNDMCVGIQPFDARNVDIFLDERAQDAKRRDVRGRRWYCGFVESTRV